MYVYYANYACILDLSVYLYFPGVSTLPHNCFKHWVCLETQNAPFGFTHKSSLSSWKWVCDCKLNQVDFAQLLAQALTTEETCHDIHAHRVVYISSWSEVVYLVGLILSSLQFLVDPRLCLNRVSLKLLMVKGVLQATAPCSAPASQLSAALH